MPSVLDGWDGEVDRWCVEYCDILPEASISEIRLSSAVFLFDHALDRVVLAYAVSTPQLHARDKNRMRGFPDVNVGVRNALGASAFPADRGHFLGHASGGELDVNLFPQHRQLNRGWSAEGKRFRAMERFTAAHPGCFFFHRPLYDDRTWIPASLSFGILRSDHTWWRDEFPNKEARAS